MNSGKIDGRLVRRDRRAKITEGIKRDGRSDELRRARIKDRVGLVQDPVESRGGHLRASNRIFKLTVAEPGVVSPAPVKKLVPLNADRAQPGIGFVIE